MDEKQILIRIRTEFKEAALGSLKNGLNNLSANIKSTFQSLPSVAGKAISNVTHNLTGLSKGILNTINPLRMFNTLFGRVTLAMLTWQAWRWVAQGFQAIGEAIFGTNAAIQTAEAAFSALTGSSDKASKLIGIVRDVAMETGVSFSDLVFESRRLTTQIGQNEQAFQEVTKAAVALSVIDPVQGITGAMFALSNFLEGTAQGARSLAQRFELPFGVLKQALKDTETPIEALQLAFQRLGIDVDDLIARGRYTLPVIISNLREMLRFFLQMSTQPFVTKLTQDLARLRDFIEANKNQILGLAQAIGQMLGRLYMYVRTLLQGLFPGLAKIFSVKLPEFKDRAKGIVKDFTEGAAEGAVEETAKIAAEAAAGAQQAAAEAAIAALQGTEQAQKEMIRRLEGWVDEAAKVVQDKRDEMRLFDLMTEDIPERFTRGRRRQLEFELLAAEQEERRRKEALELAQQQLQATQDQIAAQKELVQALKDVADIGGEIGAIGDGADLGFGEIDLSESEAAIDEWASVWSGKLAETEKNLRDFITKVAQLMRGLFGQEALTEPGFPGQVVPFEEFYETGKGIRAIIGQVGDAIGKVWEGVTIAFTTINDTWNNLDPGVRKILLAIVGGLLFPKLAFVAGLVLELNDPGNIYGMLAILMSLGVGRIVTNIVIDLTLQGLNSAASWLLGAIGAGGLTTLAAITLPLILIAEIWLGRKELSKWISGERVEELKAIIEIVGVKEAVGQIAEGAGESIAKNVLGLDDKGIQNLGQWLADTAAKLGLTFGEDMTSSSMLAITGAEGDMEAATEQGVKKPIGKVFQDLFDMIVGGSIIPDLLNEVVNLFTGLPGRLTSPLVALMNLMRAVMGAIKAQWVADWNQMVMVAASSLRTISQIQAQISQIQLQMSQASMPTAATLPAGTGQSQLDALRDALSQLPFGGALAEGLPISLELDADETKKFFEEGTYSALLTLPTS